MNGLFMSREQLTHAATDDVGTNGAGYNVFDSHEGSLKSLLAWNPHDAAVTKLKGLVQCLTCAGCNENLTID